MLKINEGPFDRFGGRFKKIIDPEHFLGQTAFDIPYTESFPRANLIRSGEAFHIDLLVPGFTRDELKVIMDRGVLCVSGKKEREISNKDDEMIIGEFGIESFQRKFSLHKEFYDNHMEAFLRDGILRIVIYHKHDPVISEQKRIIVSE